jgi:nucleotide-binding universal stress UspA family protein
MVKRILVTLSANRYTAAAVGHATELAQLHGAELFGVTDINERAVEATGPVPIGGGSMARQLAETRRATVTEHIQEVVESFESSCRDASVKFSVHREHGEPYEQLMRLWRYCDLTLSGLQGLFSYDVIKSPKDVVIKLVSKGIQPILAVAEEYRPVRNVTIAYNGSLASAKSMKRFVQMRLWPDVKIRIVSLGFPFDEGEQLVGDASDYCRAHGYEVETECGSDTGHDALLDVGDRMETDLIVMGSTSRSRIAQRLLGDTVSHMIQHSEVPLFLAQ